MKRDALLLLERRLHLEVPLTRHMGVSLDRYQDGELWVQADFASNVNIHGTAFGGSLFSLCAVACWGLLHLSFEEQAVNAHTVLGHASIDYYLPVKGELRVKSGMPEDGSFPQFLSRLKRGDRASITLEAAIETSRGRAVRFCGDYAAQHSGGRDGD